MERMSRAELIDRYNLSVEECYDIPEPGICPECGEQTLFATGKENYGADADGRRGVMITNYGCSECGYEG